MAFQSLVFVVVMPFLAWVRVEHFVTTRELWDILVVAGYAQIFWINLAFCLWLHKARLSTP
ncbi:MAG: hypothetical protein H0X01_00605 [Nitrospira sp.]|nr:hypothetical protein [Nitrospira sp.]